MGLIGTGLGRISDFRKLKTLRRGLDFRRSQDRLVVVGKNVAIHLAVHKIAVVIDPPVGGALIGRLARFIGHKKSLTRNHHNPPERAVAIVAEGRKLQFLPRNIQSPEQIDFGVEHADRAIGRAADQNPLFIDRNIHGQRNRH